MRSQTSIRVLGIALLAAVTGLTACGGSQAPQSRSGGTLTVLINGAPDSLNPAESANGANGTWIEEAAYGTLIYKSPDGTYEPGLATSWKYGPDNRTFTMTIADGVKFSNGSTLTAQDVANSLNYYRKANGPLSASLSPISSVVAQGADSVVVSLSSSVANLPEFFSQLYSGYIIGPSGIANPKSLSNGTDGTGPYMVDSKDTILNSQYTFVRNPYYKGSPSAAYQKVIIKVVADPNAALSALETGQAQVSQGDQTTASAAARAGIQVINAATGVESIFLMDRAGKVTPALGNVKVRQALNYAINRAAIVTGLLGKFGNPTDQVSVPGFDGYEATLESMYPFDIARAKSLLAQAGYPKGFSFTLLTEASPAIEGKLASAVVAYWSQIGVQATIKQDATFNEFLSDWTGKKYPAAMFGLGAAPLYVNAGYDFVPNGILNPFGSQAAPLETLLNAVNTGTTTQSDQAAQEAESFLTSNAWMVPIAASDDVYFAVKGVQGVSVSSTQWVPDLAYWKPAG